MTNTYDTSNEPLGSPAVKVLYNNASNLDDAVNSTADTWVDRFGRVRRAWRGMENAFEQALLKIGYEFIGDYDADGPLTITATNQVFSKDGEYWRAGPSLDLPYTTVNNWTVDQPKFVSTGDATLRNDLLQPSGSTRVRHLSQLLSEKFGEMVSIRDYGGGEEVADNAAAWNAAVAAVGTGGFVELPVLGNGEFEWLSPADLRGVVIVPGKGAKILTPTGFHIFSDELVTTEDLVVRVTSGPVKDYEYTILANFRKGSKTGSKEKGLTPSDLRDTRPVAVLADSQLKYRQVQLGLSDTFTDITPAGANADTLSLTPPSGGRTQLGLYPLRKGQQLTAGIDLLPDANGEIAAGIVWSTGYAVLRGASAAGAWTWSVKYQGVPVSETAVTRPDGNGDTPGYFPAQNHIAIRFLAFNRAQVLISGIVAVEIQLTSGFLMYAGFGGTTTGSSSSISWNGWYISEFNVSVGSRPATLGLFGDSLSAAIHGAWVWDAVKILDGSLGIRIVGVENHAVAGDSTQDQLNDLTTNPFQLASNVILFTSTNDIQLGVSLADFKAAYAAAINRLQNVEGRRVALVIPPLWYTQAQTGGAGAGSVRSEYGGNIRAAIGRFAADYGVPLVDLSSVSGAISAAFLSNTFTDSMLRDNIHQTAYFNEVVAEAIARDAIAPMITQVVVGDNPWLSVPASLYQSGVTGSLEFRVLPGTPARVEFRGTVTLPSAATQGQKLLDVPEHIATSSDRKSAVFGASSSSVFTGFCQVGADRQVKVYGVVGATHVTFDGVSYTI